MTNLATIMREKTNEAIATQNSKNLQTLKNEIVAKIQEAAGNGESELRFFIDRRPRPLNENVGVVIPSKLVDEIRNWLVSEGFYITFPEYHRISW